MNKSIEQLEKEIEADRIAVLTLEDTIQEVYARKTASTTDSEGACFISLALMVNVFN